MAATTSLGKYTFIEAFNEDPEVQPFGSNSLLLFTLSLYLRTEDVKQLAADGLTDGGDDKKVDFCYVDIATGRAVIAQAYLSKSWGKQSALANKASELNTATTWLLSANESRIPPKLLPKAIELRQGLKTGEIKHIEILYVHNCRESKNVDSELKSVADAARAKIEALGGEDVIILSREFGLQRIEDLYKSRDTEILVDEMISLPGAAVTSESGTGWRAVIVTVSGGWLQALYQKHGSRLFSANFRDYMGAPERKGNINLGIKTTTSSEPTNLWVYNNGVTALTHEIRDMRGKRSIRGISIINGAQTTGALGESDVNHAKKTKVLFRVVQCNDKELIKKIIQFNNTQNAIRPADQRSKDAVQTRLAREFEAYSIPYVHRRSATRYLRNTISATAIGPFLCAFHGDLQTASRSSADIFQNDATYQKVFRQDLSSEHVYLVNSLASAIDDLKYDLKVKLGKEKATNLEEEQYEVLRYSTSKYFIMFLVGKTREEIIASRIVDPFAWKAKSGVVGPEKVALQKAWTSALQALLPLITNLTRQTGTPYDVVRSTLLSSKVADTLKALISSLQQVIGTQFDPLRKTSEW